MFICVKKVIGRLELLFFEALENYSYTIVLSRQQGYQLNSYYPKLRFFHFWFIIEP